MLHLNQNISGKDGRLFFFGENFLKVACVILPFKKLLETSFIAEMLDTSINFYNVSVGIWKKTLRKLLV